MLSQYDTKIGTTVWQKKCKRQNTYGSALPQSCISVICNMYIYRQKNPTLQFFFRLYFGSLSAGPEISYYLLANNMEI